MAGETLMGLQSRCVGTFGMPGYTDFMNMRNWMVANASMPAYGDLVNFWNWAWTHSPGGGGGK